MANAATALLARIGDALDAVSDDEREDVIRHVEEVVGMSSARRTALMTLTRRN